MSQPSTQSILLSYSHSLLDPLEVPLSEFKLLVSQLIDHKFDAVTVVLETLYNSLMPNTFLSKDLNLHNVSELADFAQSISSVDIGVWMKDLILAHVDYTFQSFDDPNFRIMINYVDLYLEYAKSLRIKLDDLAQKDVAASFQHMFDRTIEELFFTDVVKYVEMDRKWNFGLSIPDYPKQIKEVLEDFFQQQLSKPLKTLLSPDSSHKSFHIGIALKLIQAAMYLKISFRQDVKELARGLLHSPSGSEGFPNYSKIALMIGAHESEYLQG